MSVSLRGSCALSFFVVALAWPTRAQSTVAERPRVGPDPTLVGRVDPAADAAIEAAIRDAAPWNGSCGLERVDGVLYGAGPRYKVEFGAHGFRYTTALGASSPIDGTLAFELESIRLGAQVLATGTASEPSQSGGIATYARGASIHEEYVVQADGVEQRFVFDSLPAGGGDLVVRGRIATPLVARDVDDTPGDGESPLGIRFEAPGYGSFVYGGVTGIDANGARAAGLVRFDGEHIELSLPESFVAHAALPLVLDPLLGSNVNVSGGLDLSRSDVAFDVTHNLYLVVWSVNFSSSNADVHGQRISPSGAKVGGLVLIEPYTNVSSGAPTVANNNGANRFLVAWPQTPSSLGGANDLVCRIVNASNGGISNVIQFAINGGELDSGGEMLEGYLNVQVVWQDSGIRGRAITVPATGDPGFGTTYVLAASTDALAPSISKSGGLPGRYLVAWRQKYGTYAWSQILGRTVHYDATLGPAAIDFTTHATAQKSDPAVDGDGVDFLVAYESVTIGGSTFDLKCKRVHWNGSFPAPDANETTIDPALHFAPHAAVSLLGGALLTGSATKYAVAWEDIDTGGPKWMRYRELDPATCLPCGQQKTLNISSYWAALASEVGGGGSGATDGGMAVFVEVNGGIADVMAQPVEALGAGGSVTDFGLGCAGGGTGSVNGPVAIGNKQFEFRLTGAVSGAPVAVHNMNFSPNYLSCGSCVGLLPGVLHTRPLVAGAAVFPSPIPCSASALGVFLESQWIVLSVPTVPCPQFANIATSNIQELIVGE